MNDKKIKIIIPGDFEKEHFSSDQEQYVTQLALECDAKVLLLHVGNPDSLPQTDNQASFLRAFNKLSKRIESNTQALCERFKKEGMEVTNAVLGVGNIKNELSDHVELYAADFVILKSPEQILFRYLSNKTPILFIPNQISQKLPKQISLIGTSKNLLNINKWRFFLMLTRKTTGQLSVIKIGQKGESQEDKSLQKELNEINLSYGINVNLINHSDDLLLPKLKELIQKNYAELFFILTEKEKRIDRLSPQGSPIKQLIKKVNCPMFVYTVSTAV